MRIKGTGTDITTVFYLEDIEWPARPRIPTSQELCLLDDPMIEATNIRCGQGHAPMEINAHHGSSFDSFLDEEGILAEVEAAAVAQCQRRKRNRIK